MKERPKHPYRNQDRRWVPAELNKYLVWETGQNPQISHETVDEFKSIINSNAKEKRIQFFFSLNPVVFGMENRNCSPPGGA